MIHQYDDRERRVKQRASSITDELRQETAPRLSHYFEEQPVKSVLIGLGVGIGTGLLLGTLLRETTKKMSQETVFRERMGNQLKDSLSEIVPGSLKKHFNSM